MPGNLHEITPSREDSRRFVKDRMGFDQKKRTVLAKHPMAYMRELSRAH